MSGQIDSKDVADKRSVAIGRMISSVKRGEPSKYFVGLVGYFIEGNPYPATGLSVDLAATTDIYQTESGFSCTAFFPPNALQPAIVKKNGTVKKQSGSQVVEVVPVRLEVKLIDIWAVAEFINGIQHDLFIDPQTLTSRQMQFRAETEQ